MCGQQKATYKRFSLADHKSYHHQIDYFTYLLIAPNILSLHLSFSLSLSLFLGLSLIQTHVSSLQWYIFFFVIIYQKYVTKTLTSTAPNFVIFYYVLLAAFLWGQSLTKINDCDIYFCLINLDIHGHNKSQALYENQFITF